MKYSICFPEPPLSLWFLVKFVTEWCFHENLGGEVDEWLSSETCHPGLQQAGVITKGTPEVPNPPSVHPCHNGLILYTCSVCVVASAFFPRLCTCSWCYFIIALGASCYRGEEGARRISCPQSQSKDWSWSLKVDEAGTEFGESAEGIWATPGDVRPKDRVVVSFPVRNLVKQQGHKEMTAWVGPSMIWLVAVCWV